MSGLATVLAVAVILLVAAVVLLAVQLSSRRVAAPDTAPLDSFRQAMEDRLRTQQEASDRQLGRMRDSLDAALTGVQTRLQEFAGTNAQILEQAREWTALKDLFARPKMRGEMGETLLETLLADRLPGELFAFQHRFGDNEKVDAVIKLPGYLVPVDAKFPLESFRRLQSAVDDDTRRQARKDFVRDIRKHINAVAKYIRPGEGTTDFAFMYVPAESVYYEIVNPPDGSVELYEEALQARVMAVSPSTLFAYLQTLVMGFRGLKVEDRARETLAGLQALRDRLSRFAAAYGTLGSHLTNAQAKYEEARAELIRVEQRVEQMVLPEGRKDLLGGTGE